MKPCENNGCSTPTVCTLNDKPTCYQCGGYNESSTVATEDSMDAAEQHAKPIYDECGCTKYVGHPGCKHDRIYEDRQRSFLAGVRWARGQMIDEEQNA